MFDNAKFHKPPTTFGDGFDAVSVNAYKDYRNGDLSETVSADIAGFDLSDGETHAVLLDEMIARLTAARDAIPEEFRASATIDMSCSGEYGHASLSVGYTVQEPSEIRAARRVSEKSAAEAKANRDAAAAEARDRAEFARLQAKYG